MAAGSLPILANAVPYNTNAVANTLVYRDSNAGATNGPESCTQFTCSGPCVLKWNAQTASYNLSALAGGDCIVYMDCTSGNRTVNLCPPSTLGAGQVIWVIKKDTSGNTFTINPNAAETINGATSLVLTGQQTGAMIFNDGTNWVAWPLSPSRDIVPVGAAPTAAAGSNAGSSPPVPVVNASSNDVRGSLTAGTGTGPAAGNLAVVTFAVAYDVAPFVVVGATNAAGASLAPYVTSIGTTGFTIGVNTAPAASQGNTTYGFGFRVTR